MTILRCENLSKHYGSGNTTVYAIRNISTSFRENTFYSIIGKSGSGKTTFLHLLSGLLPADQGEIFYKEVPISSMNDTQIENMKKEIGIVFQNYQLLPELTVKENILLPCILLQQSIEPLWCNEILEKLEITDIQNKYPAQLSGGQQQRCAIARAFINHPTLLFCDEPTGNLDKKTSESILNFLLEIQRFSKTTIILVTHDLDIARSADKILHIEDGTLAGDCQ